MSTTDELRRLLDERGVKWYETVNHVNCVFTWWDSPTFGEVHAMDNEDDMTLFMACLNNCDFTPEQAIAATLGGECEWVLEHSGTLYDRWRCSECGYEYVDSRTDSGATELDPRFCPNCGRRVKR